MLKVTVQAKTGLHARPASQIVNVANQYKSDIFLEFEGNRFNCKSILSLMSSKIAHGDKVVISATGQDSTLAEQKICDIITSFVE